jgi:hypothetical protein
LWLGVKGAAACCRVAHVASGHVAVCVAGVLVLSIFRLWRLLELLETAVASVREEVVEANVQFELEKKVRLQSSSSSSSHLPFCFVFNTQPVFRWPLCEVRGRGRRHVSSTVAVGVVCCAGATEARAPG